MLDFLKSKKTEIVPLQEVDKKKQEIATVQVRDIKQYLVDEYDRAKKLEERNNYLRNELDLPCKVGPTIYIVHRYWNCVDIGNICGIAECDDVDCFCFKVYVDPDTYTVVAISDFGKEWFLTEAEAEEALSKMRGKE